MSLARLLKASSGVALASLFVLSMLPAPAAAVPGVPYCAGSFALVPQGPVQPDVCLALSGRVFPEAMVRPEYVAAGFTMGASDYVGFPEFQAGLQYLAGTPEGQQFLTIHQVAESYGLCPTPSPNPEEPAAPCTGERDRFPVYMLEVTNKESPIPLEERQSILFMLSIHGVEKGGREGGMRVLEDLLRNIGFASEGVQNGAGLPSPIAKPTGGQVATYHDYLDFMRVFLLFPNSDGWMHDELPYAAANPPACGSLPNGALFCRTNGRGIDLNRQGPTLGWQDPTREVVGEPESIGYYNWMLTNDISWDYAIDIHGMINHQNFIAIMLPAGSMTPQEMQRSIRLSETLKERLNGNPHFDAWTNLFATGEQAEDLSCSATGPECFTEGSLATAGSTTFAEYYTVIDAIGYTDSGFNGDYFAQDTGLNAPGYDIEMAYNHLNCDSQYQPCQVFNDYHVKSVREIVKSFMDAAALDVQISFETKGLRTLYLEPTYVATNLDDENPEVEGWALENAGDDIWDYGVDQPFFARPAKYWDDLRPFLRDGDQPGVLVKTTGNAVTSSKLDGFDTFVIPGSAIAEIENDTQALADIRAWVEDGGNLVLTDEGLRFLDLSGITTDAVDVHYGYMGGITMDLSHPLLAKVRGGVRQTYEPTPLGYGVTGTAPNWYVDEGAFAELGGEVAGIECAFGVGGGGQSDGTCANSGVALGQVKVGEGSVKFIGALLPDPTEEFYHPYGLDHYATTYSGNQVLRNMLGWDEAFSNAPVVISDTGEVVQSDNEPDGTGSEAEPTAETGGKDSPGVAPVAIGLALAGAALVASRRRA